MSLPQTVLIIDDDENVLRALIRVLQKHCALSTVNDAEAGLARLGEGDIAVVLVDVMLPGMTGIEFLSRARALRPDVEVIVMTGGGSVKTAVEAMRKGAYDYIQKPFESLEKLSNTVLRAAERYSLRRRNIELERIVGLRTAMPGMIGSSEAMQPIFELISAVADTPATVLVTGESGTGKELVAKSIHAMSPRAKKPFIAVNCSAFPESLLDSELFGHAKGAFTGANAQRAGVFETAHGGTLFLDEVGDIALGTQVRLLRTLQDGEIRRVGDSVPIAVDVRVVAATNVDLKKAVVEGRVREDFFYRLNVVAIHLPPLRERVTDIPALAAHFIAKHAERMGRAAASLTNEAMELLCAYPWPGNIRELENVIARAVVLSKGSTLEASSLPQNLRAAPVDTSGFSIDGLPFTEAKRLQVEQFERRYLSAKMKAADGNITKAAELAGLDRSNFRRLLKSHGFLAKADELDESIV